MMGPYRVLNPFRLTAPTLKSEDYATAPQHLQMSRNHIVHITYWYSWQRYSIDWLYAIDLNIWLTIGLSADVEVESNTVGEEIASTAMRTRYYFQSSLFFQCVMLARKICDASINEFAFLLLIQKRVMGWIAPVLFIIIYMFSLFCVHVVAESGVTSNFDCSIYSVLPFVMRSFFVSVLC